MTETLISRVIHRVWVGGPMPEHLAACYDSWRALHPHWMHNLWTDDDLDWIPNRDLYDRAADIVAPDAVEQFQSDLARYAILHRYGGLYVDADTEARRCVDPALAGYTAFAAAEEDDRWVGNTYLASEAGHPVMAALIERLPRHVATYRGPRRAGRISGPRYLTPIWHEFGCHVDPQQLWYPYSYIDVKRRSVPTEYGTAYAVHHWDHTRRVLAARQASRKTRV